MDLPLEKKVRKQLHRQVGYLQDELLEILYQLHPDFVLHGGTALWRCYQGSRFSEDIDLYANTALPKTFEADFKKTIQSRGFTLSKYKDTGQVVFAKVRDPRIEVLVEINHQQGIEAFAAPYAKMDGSTFIVFTLDKKGLLLEKISAYNNRHLVRDLYDVHFLAAQVDADEDVTKALQGLLSGFSPPVDPENLKAIVYAGAVPSVKQMTTFLQSKTR